MALRASGILPFAAALALTLPSCASRGYVPQTPTMPAARAALRPEFRIFYDALQDYGDWVLIEPYGFVFRPRVDFATFRPYQEGFWVPTDAWGWVWISAEPFGWATYHYGSWLWDRFQGWVWVPGLDWGPAWVSWRISDRYAGWAPLPPRGGAPLSGAPGGAYLYAPIERLGATDLGAHTASEAELGTVAESAEPVENTAEREGVRMHLGPPLERIERAQGMRLPRVKIEDALAAAGTAGRRGEGTAEGAPAAGVDATRQAGVSAARQARALIERGGRSPSFVPVPRPPAIGRPAEQASPAPRPGRPARGGAPADTTR